MNMWRFITFVRIEMNLKEPMLRTVGMVGYYDRKFFISSGLFQSACMKLSRCLAQTKGKQGGRLCLKAILGFEFWVLS